MHRALRKQNNPEIPKNGFVPFSFTSTTFTVILQRQRSRQRQQNGNQRFQHAQESFSCDKPPPACRLRVGEEAFRPVSAYGRAAPPQSLHLRTFSTYSAPHFGHQRHNSLLLPDENRQRRIILRFIHSTAEHGIGSVVEFPQVSQNRVALLIAVFLLPNRAQAPSIRLLSSFSPASTAGSEVSAVVNFVGSPPGRRPKLNTMQSTVSGSA